MNPAKPTTVLEVIGEESLSHWLCDADGSLPGEFLRSHGLDPEELVSQGLLQAAAGRWSESYVAGPMLRRQQFEVPVKSGP